MTTMMTKVCSLVFWATLYSDAQCLLCSVVFSADSVLWNGRGYLEYHDLRMSLADVTNIASLKRFRRLFPQGKLGNSV